MAPDTVANWLRALPARARVLDPMCGSGVVVRQSALLGHRAKGFDIDPLAVLMSKVWTRKGKHDAVRDVASRLLSRAAGLRNISYRDLPWIARCSETQAFVEYWFAERQRSALARVALEIDRLRKNGEDNWICDVLNVALSRIIVTKTVGASLAWDVSHSRPHRVRDENDFDVFDGFNRAISRLVDLLDAEILQERGVVKQGDCRKLFSLRRASIDAIVTSPPYLNAIDYLRGHKLALVWMGHSIPSLRNIRAGSIGTERAGPQHPSTEATDLERAVQCIRKLPQRQRAIVHKYARDADLMLQEMKRVLADDGLMVLVLGDSNLRGVPVYNSKIFTHLAVKNGFVLEEERKRPLESNRRYLPIESSSALAKRMKIEVLQAYRLASSA
jgi:hypothetical protein